MQPSSANTSRRIGPSIAAVLAGFLVTAVLSTLMDAAMHGTGVFPPWGEPMSDGLFGWAATYRVAFAIFGGYLTAVLAPRRPLAHAIALGVLGTLAATIGVVATWDKGPAFGPKWYPIALIVTAVPSTWLGGIAGAARHRQKHPVVESA